jgi:hypothetical protein
LKNRPSLGSRGLTPRSPGSHGPPASRPTRDIDLLAWLENTVELVVPVFRDVCGFVVEPEGVVFVPSVGRRYPDHGIRIACLSCLFPVCFSAWKRLEDVVK